MTILAALTPGLLHEFFDARTIRAGIDYARQGRVGEPALLKQTRDTVIVTASVHGTAAQPYSTHLYVELFDDEFWMTTTCSCPVRVDCKHGAALAVSVCARQETPTVEPPVWRQQLAPVLDELNQHGASDEPVPLALEVSVDDRRWIHRTAATTFVLRPMRRGAKGGWVKSGADWTNLAAAHGRRGFRRNELDALLDLVAALQFSSPYWRSGGGPVDLAAFGDRLVTLLRRAADAGMPLLAGAGLESVELLDERLEVVCDAIRHADGVSELRVGVQHAERMWRGAAVVPLGAPAHAVGLLEDGALVLGGTTAAVPAALTRLLAGGTDVAVPSSETEAVDDILRRLSRSVSIVSSDGSVPIPEPIRPILRLTVTWHRSVDATLAWSWRYADRACALGSRETLDGLRDRAAEVPVLDRVPGELLAMTRARGGDALALAIHDLPSLRELDDVEVVEEQPPDFRESESTPEISFDLVPAEDGAEQTDWLDLHVAITVEGERVPLPDVLEALTRGEEFLVLPSGLYLSTDRPELARLRDAVRAAAELRETEGDRVSVGRHDLGVWAQLAELGVVDAQAGEWVRRAQALRDLTDLPRPEPVGLSVELRPYQREGFHWLAFLWEHQLGGILADDMGLGKTLQVLALISHAVRAGEQRPFLVVAPTSVVTAWQSESARHAPDLRVRTATRKVDDIAALSLDADVVVTTYALLRLAQDRYAEVPWGGLVLDEAQQVKNHQSKTYAAVRSIDAPFRVAVTGTPFENRLMELWSLLSIVTPGIYPWPRAFTEHVARPVEKNGDDAALQRFRQRIRPFMLRRTKELVARDLPPKQEQVLSVVLEARHRRIYDTHLAKERQRILGLVEDFEANRIAIFSALTKLRQLALDPALLDPAHDAVGSAKVDLLVEHLAEITAEGHRALVFSQFTSFLHRVQDRLNREGIAYAYLDGTTRDRAAAITEFREGGAPVFLISLKAGGVGLTLTEADYVFVLDPWWNPATEAQAVDRAHRIGQTRPVHVYRLIAEETIEEKVMELKERKAELFAQVVDGEGASAAGITAEDIRALFEG